MEWWARVVCAVAMTTSAGCDDDDSCEDVDEVATLEIGGGSLQSGFVPLEDGAEMELTLGPTGLYMVIASLRVSGIDPGMAGRVASELDPLVEIEALLDTTQIGALGVCGTGQEYYGMQTTEYGAELLGVWVSFPTAALDDLVGQTLTLRAQVTDVCGRHASNELTVRIVNQSATAATAPVISPTQVPNVLASCH